MERRADLKEAKKILGRNFVGPNELLRINKRLKILVPKNNLPKIPLKTKDLIKLKKDYILILGINKDKHGRPLTINRLREIFGLDPKKSEPCFYNQDWYLQEKFASKKTLETKWYIIKKTVSTKTKGKTPQEIDRILTKKESFPSAILATFAFFSYYLLNRKILWKEDFIWCKDSDSNGDRIYVGRYIDPKKINKDGFNIHRHLSIKKCYGLAPEIL